MSMPPRICRKRSAGEDEEWNRFGAVDGARVRVVLNEAVVACLLGPARNLIQGVIPGDVLPLGRAWTPDLRLREPPRVEHVLFERRALRAQRSPIGGMIGVAFDVDHLRRDVLRPVTNRVDKDATTR